MRPGAVLGVDIGGTSVTADLVTCDGVSLEARRRPTGHGDAALDTLASLLVECAGMAATHGVQLQGIGVLSPGHVEEVSGVVHFASNLGWREVPLAAALRRIPEIAEVPLTVGHDVRWAGIAEGNVRRRPGRARLRGAVDRDRHRRVPGGGRGRPLRCHRKRGRGRARDGGRGR